MVTNDALPVGTTIPAGGDTPPMTAGKTVLVAVYNGVVLLLGAVPQLLPNLTEQQKAIVALIALVVSGVGTPIITYLKTNQLKQAVMVMAAPGEPVPATPSTTTPPPVQPR